MGMGIDMAECPTPSMGVHRGSPVVDRPSGAGPTAAGVRITGVGFGKSPQSHPALGKKVLVRRTVR